MGLVYEFTNVYKLNMKRLLLSVLLSVLIADFSFAQTKDTLWFNNKWEKSTKENSHFYRVIQPDSLNATYIIKDFYPNGVIQMQGYLSSINPEIREGLFTYFSENGTKNRYALFKNNVVSDVVNIDPDFKKDVIITVKRENGNEISEIKFIDKAPKFPNGEHALSKFISNNIIYPSKAKRNNIEGVVVVKFTVNKSGEIINSEVITSPDDSLSKEALRVVN